LAHHFLWSRLSIGNARFRAATEGSGYFLTSLDSEDCAVEPGLAKGQAE
jgi:hypothetical protein